MNQDNNTTLSLEQCFELKRITDAANQMNADQLRSYVIELARLNMSIRNMTSELLKKDLTNRFSSY